MKTYTEYRDCAICRASFLITSSSSKYCSKDCRRVFLRENWLRCYHNNKKAYDDKSRAWKAAHPDVVRETKIRYIRKMGAVSRDEYLSSLPRGRDHKWYNGGGTTDMISRLNDPAWKKLRIKVWKRDGFKCAHCGIKLGDGKKPVTHHITPWKETMDDSIDNLITMCNSCHLKEHHRMRKEILV